MNNEQESETEIIEHFKPESEENNMQIAKKHNARLTLKLRSKEEQDICNRATD